MKKISERLAEERVRLNMNKSQMASAGKVANSTYTNYEEGNRSPDADFLAAIAEAGVDVQYILTGVRYNAIANDPAAYTVLNKREQALLANYRAIDDEEDKRLIERTAQLAAEPGHIEVKQNKKGGK